MIMYPLAAALCHPLVAFLVFALVALNDSGTDARYTNCNDFQSFCDTGLLAIQLFQ